MIRDVDCPRCKNGQMRLDNMENEDFCLQCGYRRPHQEARKVNEAPRDPYEQLLDVVAQALQLVQAAGSRSEGIATTHRREAAKRRQQVRRIARALKVLKGERLVAPRREGARKPGPRPKLRAVPAEEA